MRSTQRNKITFIFCYLRNIISIKKCRAHYQWIILSFFPNPTVLTDFLVLFKKSKIEGLVWLVTFVAVIVFDVDIGLYVGLLSNLFIIIIKSQR